MKEAKKLNPKFKVRESEKNSLDYIWCLKKFKLDSFADIEVLPEWIINLKEYKLFDDLIKTQL